MDYSQAIVSISMFFLFVFVGVPVWWHTTKVYRAPLPYDRIVAVESSKYKVKVDIRLFSDTEINMDLILKKLSLSERIEIRFSTDNLTLVYADSPEQICDNLKQKFVTEKLHGYNIVVTKTNSPKWYDCKTHSTFIVMDSNMIVDLLKIVLPEEKSVDIKKKARNIEASKSLPISASYNLLFTLAIADPRDCSPTWNIKDALDEFMTPFLEQLEFLGPFHVSSQVLYFTDVKVKPKQNGSIYYYHKSKLPLLINPLESRLNTFTSTDRSLNFILYIPPFSYSPLFLRRRKSDEELYTSFHSPRWGGIKVFNCNPDKRNKSMDSISQGDMKNIMGTYLVQFLALNGIQLDECTKKFSNYDTLDVLPAWISQKLLIQKTLKHVHTSTQTLVSLIKLLNGIATIVIKDEVKALIDSSVSSIEQSLNLLQNKDQNADVNRAFYHAKNAFLNSEKAFFDPSLLALLYFPDDQKYAIYVPLFVPISIPVVLSFFKAVKWMREKDI